MKQLRVVIITGLSGSGKSTALRALEDIGFFCVDNLPVVLLPKFLEIQSDPAKEITQVAMVMDLRERGFLEKYPRIFTRLKEKGYRIEVLFFDAADEAILHRFSETRRSHPLAPRGSLMDGISLEREKLASLKRMADKVIDTTSCNVHQLKDIVQRYFLGAKLGKEAGDPCDLFRLPLRAAGGCGHGPGRPFPAQSPFRRGVALLRRP